MLEKDPNTWQLVFFWTRIWTRYLTKPSQLSLTLGFSLTLFIWHFMFKYANATIYAQKRKEEAKLLKINKKPQNNPVVRGDIGQVHFMNILKKLYISLSHNFTYFHFFFNFFFYKFYAVVRFTTKNCLVRVWRRSYFGLKYLFWWEIIQRSAKKISSQTFTHVDTSWAVATAAFKNMWRSGDMAHLVEMLLWFWPGMYKPL